VDLRYDGQVIVNPDSTTGRAKDIAPAPEATTENTSRAAPPAQPNKSAAPKKAKRHS